MSQDIYIKNVRLCYEYFYHYHIVPVNCKMQIINYQVGNQITL